VALSLLGDDSVRNELAAYFYSYEAMRSVATIINSPKGVNEHGDGYLPCEAVGTGLIPMLYITGQFSPRPDWLRWIMEQLNTSDKKAFST